MWKYIRAAHESRLISQMSGIPTIFRSFSDACLSDRISVTLIPGVLLPRCYFRDTQLRSSDSTFFRSESQFIVCVLDEGLVFFY